jgi:hypothetical protein
MADARIGRVLPASLHHAVAVRLPARLDFYEDWLKPSSLVHGSVPPSAVLAVLSFLRQEVDRGRAVTVLAGAAAAEWTFDQQPAWRRLWWRCLPVRARARRAIGLLRDLMRSTSETCRVRGRLSAGLARLDVVDSLFCDSKRVSDVPDCWFAAGAARRFLERVRVHAQVDIDACRSMGQTAGCVLVVELLGTLRAVPPLDTETDEDATTDERDGQA